MNAAESAGVLLLLVLYWTPVTLHGLIVLFLCG